MPDHHIDVIDIGLTIADAVAMELEPETFCRNKKFVTNLTLSDLESEYFTGNRGITDKGKMGWIGCKRFELNAMTSRELVNYTETAIKASGTPAKVIPPLPEQVKKANGCLEVLIRRCVDDFYNLDEIKVDLCKKYAIESQDFNAEAYLDKYPAKTWKDAVKASVDELFVKIGESVNEDLTNENDI